MQGLAQEGAPKKLSRHRKKRVKWERGLGVVLAETSVPARPSSQESKGKKLKRRIGQIGCKGEGRMAKQGEGGGD